MAISPSLLVQTPIPGFDPTLGLNPGQVPVIPGLNTSLPGGVNPAALFSAPFPGINQVPGANGANLQLPGSQVLLSPQAGIPQGVAPQTLGLQALSMLQQPVQTALPLTSQLRQQPVLIQPQPSGAREIEEEGKGPGKGRSKGKGSGHIPPGLAKKDPASLPDGNPWKQILTEQKKQQEQQAKMQGGPQAPIQMLPVVSPLMRPALPSGGAQQVPVLIPVQIG